MVAFGWRGISRPIAWVLVWAGRVLLVGAPAVALVCYFSRDAWRAAPVDAEGFSTHWLPNLTIFLLLLWSVCLPALLLPVGSDSLTTETTSEITAVTVLGKRRLTLPIRRLRQLYVPAEGGGGYEVIVATGNDHRRRVLTTSDGWGGITIVKAITASRPIRGRDRIAGWAGFAGWMLIALVLGSVLAGAAGALQFVPAQ